MADTVPNAAAGWRVRQLTDGTSSGLYHAHSYYDIPVIDSAGLLVAGFEVGFAGRHPRPDDEVVVGVAALDGTGWTRLGESTAWSWQQGPMAQWCPGTTSLVWNDRADGRIVARTVDVETGGRRTLPRPVYAIDPAGRFALTLDFSRLDALRPGYGYARTGTDGSGERAPADNGIWRMDLETGDAELILSLDEAAAFLRPLLSLPARLQHRLRSYHYWFNHIKLNPSGTRFTAKLRYRTAGGRWSDAQGASLTCGVDGRDLRLLETATSHVLWRTDDELYLWRRDGMYLYRDLPGGGRRMGPLARGSVTRNVHMRHLPHDPETFVHDTPYREEVELHLYDIRTDASTRIAGFRNHRPASGPFRCDLHPVPTPDGRAFVVTSMQDGGRQIYLVDPEGGRG